MSEIDNNKGSSLSNSYDDGTNDVSLTKEEMEVFRSIVEKNPEEAANILKMRLSPYKFLIQAPLWDHFHHHHH